jgi:TRAP-type C4-dicarboxylate transport system permease small subunit
VSDRAVQAGLQEPAPAPADRLRGALRALAVALLACYFVLVLLQVLFRYVLHDSLYWAEELVRGLMVWGVMLGSALVAASHAHIRVEALELMLPPAGRRVVIWIGKSLALGFCLLMVVAGIQLIERTWFQQSPMLDVPKWTVYMAIPVGAALESILLLLFWNRKPAADHTESLVL